MISINVGGNCPGPSPCFPEHVDARAGGSVLSVRERKNKEELEAMLSRGKGREAD